MISDKQLNTADMQVEDWPEPDAREVFRGAVSDVLAGTEWETPVDELRPRH